MASRRRPVRQAAVGVTLAILVAACGSTRSSPPTTVGTTTAPKKTVPPTRPKGFFTLTLNDYVRNSANVVCPRDTPGGAQCFVLVETGTSPQLGAAKVAPVLDVEYPPTSSRCGASHAFVERLVFKRGDVLASVRAPYLCLGAIGTTHRTFTVVSGTSGFATDSGSGTVQFTTTSLGASESWEGTLRRR